MTEFELKKPRSGVRTMTLAMSTTTSFKDLVHILEKTLTVPELPGIKGCAPCLSGIDRLLIQDETLSTIR
jgi:hypothetical protein